MRDAIRVASSAAPKAGLAYLIRKVLEDAGLPVVVQADDIKVKGAGWSARAKLVTSRYRTYVPVTIISEDMSVPESLKGFQFRFQRVDRLLISPLAD